MNDWTDDGWTPLEENTAYTARAQAIVEALADYEAAHPLGAPCFHDALLAMQQEFTP